MKKTTVTCDLCKRETNDPRYASLTIDTIHKFSFDVCPMCLPKIDHITVLGFLKRIWQVIW